MEREVTARQFRDDLADQLDAVQHQGESLIVTRRGRKAVAVVPVPRYRAAWAITDGVSAFRLRMFNRHQQRDEVAAEFRGIAADSDRDGRKTVELPAGEADAIEFLLRELGALYAGDQLGQLAQDLAEQMVKRRYGQVAPSPIK